MYEKDGEKYYVFDSHLHFWDASPENWRPGAEEYAKGWIECFHAYQGLGPADTHWPLEHFQKYSIEDFEKDVFGAGVDKAVLQSTYLKEWYTNGFNDIDQNAALLDRFGDKLILNGRFDPREGRAGLEQLEKDHARYGLKGVKLYTAEWYQGSRGWKLTDPEAVPFLDKCAELGIKNIHVHKGPTIWPLDKDAFDVSDIDHVATDYNGELNFIVEHVGLPRIEDFCFMATQEPNVYAGLAVVIGGLSHARPNFFNKVMGELLFWVGEDKILFGSDYGIWEPRWQIEKFLGWEMPDREEYADYPRLDEDGKRKILGLNGAKLYGVEVPAHLRGTVPAEEPASEESAVGVAG
jgi:predicted TIM-barrel fold metal-dependent hydrolase